MAFSLFSSFMSPMRMNNPRSQSYVPSFQTLPYFLSHFPLISSFCWFFFSFSFSILRHPSSISCAFFLPLQVSNLFLPQEFISFIQETLLLALQSHINQESIFHFLSVMDSDFCVTGFGKAHKEDESSTIAISQQYQTNYTGKHNQPLFIWGKIPSAS